MTQLPKAKITDLQQGEVTFPLMPAGKRYRLDEDWSYEFTQDGERYRITIYAGFTWDGATTAQIGGLVGLQPGGAILLPSMPHDALYRWQGDTDTDEYKLLEIKEFWTCPPHEVNRHFADRLFKNMMDKAGIGWWRRNIAYWFVRGPFGAIAWWRTEELKQQAQETSD